MHLTEATEAMMGEAKMLSASLENQMGRAAREDLILSHKNQVVVSKGQVVTREHLARLNELAQHALSQLQAEMADEREATVTELDAIQADIRHAVGEEQARQQEAYADQLAQLRDTHERDVEELEGLAPMQFFGEARYRELRSKWGNVFQAGMGAEAFYDYLCDLDLDALAKELWKEVRHGTSKQRRKRATRRLRVVEAFRSSRNRP